MSPFKKTSGFTLVEVLIGMSLSLMVMGAVLSGYIFLGRNFTRSLGLSSANQPALESQSRRALAYFADDVRMTSGLDLGGVAPHVAPSSSGVTLILPAGTGQKYITYFFNDTDAPAPLDTFIIPAHSLVRIDHAAGSAQTLHTNLLSVSFAYFDSSGRQYPSSPTPYTSTTAYLSGIKQISLSFTAQAGSAANGTLTQIFSSASPLLILRNKPLLQ